MDLFGKQHAGNLRGRTWKLEEFEEYFRDEGKKSGNSQSFQEVASALEEFSKLQDLPISLESAKKMMKASEILKKACEQYSSSHENARSASGRERLAVVDSLAMFREDLNLDQARDMRVVREQEGKTWRQAGAFKMAEVEMGADVQVIGDNVNKRYKVECGGKTGFFTERYYLNTQQGHLDQIIDGIDPREKDFKEVMENYQEEFKARLEKLDDAVYSDVRFSCCVGEHWNQMDEKAPGRKELGKIFGDEKGLNKAAAVVKAYQESVREREGKLKAGEKLGKKEELGLMEEAIEKTLGDGDEKLKKVFSTYKEFLTGVNPPEPGMTESTNKYRYFQLAVIQEKAKKVGEAGFLNSGKKEIKAFDQLINDGSLLGKFVRSESQAKAVSDLTKGFLGVKADEGYELTDRNVATSRIAELLGVGPIAAHSEKMKVRIGGKVLTGCFMEMADGVVADSKNEKVRRMLDQVEVKQNPGFYRDMTTLEVFDYLCAQNDRHSKNMAYQLSEPDENGKRSIIGLQGIDNDLSFGSSKEYWLKEQGSSIENMTFIDEGMAEHIRKLDRETLEYALGDVIPQNQIDVMMERVEKFKAHMEKNMVTVKPDGWDLKEYAIDEKVADTDERGKRYINGLKSFEKTLQAEREERFTNAILGKKIEHKDAFITHHFKDMQAERAAGPKVALDFKELQSRESRDALKRNPKFHLAERRKNATELRKKENQAAEPQKKTKQAEGPHK